MPTVLIKRYPNRKLYNTDAKRYITLDTIAELIRDGNDVEVRDHRPAPDEEEPRDVNQRQTQQGLNQRVLEFGYLPAQERPDRIVADRAIRVDVGHHREQQDRDDRAEQDHLSDVGG